MNRNPGANGYDTADEWIDDVLAVYAKAEPRAGFEGRVLARLVVAQEQPRQNGWWRWVFAFGAAAMFLLTLLWLGYSNAKHASETQTTIAVPKSTEPNAKVNQDGSANEQIAHLKRDRRELARVIVKNGFPHTVPPKQEQFPAALPLNDQERMLARYVQDFPEKAALVARAQSDLHKLDELEMSGPEKDLKTVDPQE